MIKIKTRHIPHRLFTSVLFMPNSPLSPDTLVRRVTLGSLAKSLRCSNGRIIEALDWLTVSGHISYEQVGKLIIIHINLPVE